VIPANIDLTISEALQLAKKVDEPGYRTIGVITKIDIMDRGTNAKNRLLGAEVPLRLGYIGVKLRSQQDNIDKKTVQDALEVFNYSVISTYL
jgi:dynamin 1-like protein